MALLSRAKRLTVGELCSLFEARCAAVAAAAARQLPDRPKRGCRPPNGVLPPVIPRLTVTTEESEEAQGSPQARPARPEGGGLRTGSSLHLQSRRLSNSSVSSTGSSSLLEDSEDDVLSDTECRSQGIVHLEHGEDTSQKKAWHTIKTMVNLPVISPFKKRYSWVQLAGHTGKKEAGNITQICDLKRISVVDLSEKNQFAVAEGSRCGCRTGEHLETLDRWRLITANCGLCRCHLSWIPFRPGAVKALSPSRLYLQGISRLAGFQRRGSTCRQTQAHSQHVCVRPSVMDCKMGISDHSYLSSENAVLFYGTVAVKRNVEEVHKDMLGCDVCRTYLEEELAKAREKPKLRKDMYKKMIEVDPLAPTAEENAQHAVTKPRYMQWRETISSSANLGFRIEGIKKADGTCNTNFKTTKTQEQVLQVFVEFIEGNTTILKKYLKRLQEINVILESSDFFKRHEVVGSSLLFVHDGSGNANVWLIDFGKTTLLPDGQTLDHRIPWQEGNREDGYLLGLDNLIGILESITER
ncbi:hypothetical protein IHE44_0013984 [Lamprotornis superbus]|uniref:Kinase n=1 Tax=Lamprotornis superbus TaxID=245042 RepID=A0A835P4F9_9PASS|nr:hypothetical protein IHE44_0013984 [Lamprotornis superbus]